MRDDKICHTTHSSEVEAEVKKAQDESEGVDADHLPASCEGPNEVDLASRGFRRVQVGHSQSVAGVEGMTGVVMGSSSSVRSMT